MFRLISLSFLVLLPLGVAAQGAEQAWCAAVGKRLRSVPAAFCEAMGLQAANVRSTQGRALMYRDQPAQPLRTAANAAPQRMPRILVVGGIHGDELTSAALVFRWLPWLREDQAMRYHWRIIPLANPDGLLANPPTRFNANGVDLNRNFSTPDWARDAHAYWRGKTGSDPRRYPGRQPASEVETRWLEHQIDEFRPDVVVSVHAPYGLLDYDGPARQPRRFGTLTLNRLGIYPGSLGNYGGVFKNLPVVTIELHNAASMPAQREQRQIWQDMLEWLDRNIAQRATS